MPLIENFYDKLLRYSAKCRLIASGSPACLFKKWVRVNQSLFQRGLPGSAKFVSFIEELSSVSGKPTPHNSTRSCPAASW